MDGIVEGREGWMGREEGRIGRKDGWVREGVMGSDG